MHFHAYLVNSGKYYDIKTLIQTLGPDICRTLPFFYALTGCDIVSSFFGKGKCKMYDTWIRSVNKDELTEVFTQLGESPTEVTPHQMNVIERYLLEVYGSRATSLGAARLDMHRKSKENNLRSLPPNINSLCQHVLRACYQAGYLWRQSVEEVDIPDPKDWGWELDTSGAFFRPVWTTAESSVTIKDFTKTCSCKTGKCKTCNCAGAKLLCLSMCGCSRSCQ